MRVLIMFDLPFTSKESVRTYSKFRKTLITEGFLMLQYSIYMKLCLNKESANGIVSKLVKYIPRDGHVRALIITEKQYEKMQLLVGEEDRNSKILGDNRTIIF